MSRGDKNSLFEEDYTVITMGVKETIGGKMEGDMQNLVFLAGYIDKISRFAPPAPVRLG
jgi:hypothetical protein